MGELEPKYDQKLFDLTDDLLTVLDGHMDAIETEELFYQALKFLTVTLCQCVENDPKCHAILRRAMDEGIIDYMQHKEN